MSKITICKGNIIMTSKGDTTFHTFDGSIVSTAGGSNYWGGEQGTIVGDYEPMELPNKTSIPIVKSKCLVEFRPHSNWKGEYGFDWIRTGDTGRSGDNPLYCILGRYYIPIPNSGGEIDSCGTPKNVEEYDTPVNVTSEDYYSYKFIKDKEMFNRLTRTFSRFKITWKNPAKELPFYVVPILTLWKGRKATFSLKFEGKEKAKNITFEFENSFVEDKGYLTLERPKLDLNKISLENGNLNYLKKDCFTICCNKEFDTPQKLLVKADGKLCGAMLILPNSYKVRREIKIVIIYTETSISDKKGELVGKEESLRNFLNQAMIDPKITYENLVCKYKNKEENKKFKEECTYFNKDDGMYYLKGMNMRTFENHILKFYYEKFKDKYNDYYKIFLVGERSEKYEGFTEVWNKYSFCLLNADERTAAHEVLHSIGLDHTFEKNSDDFIYQGEQTDNVMDYQNKGVALYQWQWKLINPAIKEILNRIINEQL